jgi:hypothetical protein
MKCQHFGPAPPAEMKLQRIEEARQTGDDDAAKEEFFCREKTVLIKFTTCAQLPGHSRLLTSGGAAAAAVNCSVSHETEELEKMLQLHFPH